MDLAVRAPREGVPLDVRATSAVNDGMRWGVGCLSWSVEQVTAGDRMAVVFDVVTELCEKHRRPVFRDVAHGACMLDARLAAEVTPGQVRASIDYLVTAGMLRTSLVMDRWWLWPAIATDVLLDVRAVA